LSTRSKRAAVQGGDGGAAPRPHTSQKPAC